MTLINLEDVQKILLKISDKYQSEHTWWWIVSKIQEEFNSLPTHDPEAILKEMIEEYNTMIPSDALETLEEALSRTTNQ